MLRALSLSLSLFSSLLFSSLLSLSLSLPLSLSLSLCISCLLSLALYTLNPKSYVSVLHYFIMLSAIIMGFRRVGHFGLLVLTQGVLMAWSLSFCCCCCVSEAV